MKDDGRRTKNDGRRTTDEGRRTTDDGRRTTDDGRRMTDDGRRATDEGRRTTDDGGRWMTNDDANVMMNSYPYTLCRRRRGHLRPLSEESGGAQSALRRRTKQESVKNEKCILGDFTMGKHDFRQIRKTVWG